MSKTNHYTAFTWQNSYGIAGGQESIYYPDHIDYCRKRGIPTSDWVRKNNHIKTAH